MAVDLVISQGNTSPVLTQVITDANGNAVNLTGATVTFVMRQPRNAAATTNAAATITNPTAGAVQYSWTTSDTASPGLYSAQFNYTLSGGLTGSFPASGYLSIEVQANLVGAGQELVSVADAKDALNFISTDRSHDTKILRWVNACRPVIEAIVGPVIVTQYEEVRDGGQVFVQLMRRPSYGFGTSPIFYLNACSEYQGPIEWPLSIIQSPDFGQLYSVQLDPMFGRVVRRTAGGGVQPFPNMPQAVHVTYTAGQSVVPDNVYEATVELLRQNYQRSAQATRSAFGGGKSGGDEEPPDPPLGFFVPNRVRELLSPNRKYPSIA